MRDKGDAAAKEMSESDMSELLGPEAKSILSDDQQGSVVVHNKNITTQKEKT